jgi:hypothetical protein
MLATAGANTACAQRISFAGGQSGVDAALNALAIGNARVCAPSEWL